MTKQQTLSGYTWRQIVSLILAHKRKILGAQLIAVCATAVSVPMPLLMPLLVDEVLLARPGVVVHTLDGLFPAAWHGPLLYIFAVLAGLVVLRLMGLILNVWQTREFTLISKAVVFHIRSELVARLQNVSMAEYEILGSGQVNAHLVTDLDSVDAFIGAGVSKLFIAVLTMIGIGVVLLWLHWQMALVILILNPLIITLTVFLGRRVKKLKARENQAYAEFQQNLSNTLEGMQQLRASNRDRHYLQQVVANARNIKDHAAAYAWQTDAAGRLSFSVFSVGFDSFRALGMFMVLFSGLSIGEMLALFSYLWFMVDPLREILNAQYQYAAANAALQRVNTLFTLHAEPVYPHRANPFQDRATVAVRVENLRFAYDPQLPVLNGVSLEIAAGEKVALVGASGGGKTTLVQVLLGLYVPHAGQVYFDGVPVTDIGLDVVRDNVATVLQHPALFNDTLRANLTLGRDVSEDALWQALEIAQLKDTVVNLAQGLDTLLGQRGMRLSGGQRQRLAVARMVLMDPKVVILDEATSALDTATENRLHQALSRFLAQRTTIIIAHRLSAVKQADRAYVFEDGRIIEHGGHEELLQQKGLYAKLYGGQGEPNYSAQSA